MQLVICQCIDQYPKHSMATTTTTSCICLEIAGALKDVQARIAKCNDSLREENRHPVCLVAVSKTRSPGDVLEAYKHGQRHFGENYVQELIEKASDPLLIDLPDICWHFIGHLQRNKCNNLLSVPHIWCVETVDSDRLATTLDTSWGKKRKDPSQKLQAFVQVNTSGEASKSGSGPDSAVDIVSHIRDNCSNLEFKGLMTIGRIGHDYAAGPNQDFECLVATRQEVCQKLGLREEECGLSMGMSADFEEAIVAGSTSVRVGSMIFGARATKKTD